MPTISHFYGIIIVMFLRGKEHNPLHVHAVMQEAEASFRLADGEVLEGDLPPKAKGMVTEFIIYYQKELEEMWETGIYRKLPPIR